MRPWRLQNRFQEASGVAPGPLPGRSWGSPAAKAGLERFWGGSWRLLGLSRGALAALWGRSWRLLGRFLDPWVWEHFALLLKALNENREDLDF